MNEVVRQERKYLLTLPQAEKLNAYFSSVLPPDSHNGPDGYPVRSLYFDTPDDGDFNSKLEGLELRRKIRLRCYSPGDSFALLEMKQKEGSYQKKRSLRLERPDAQRLTQGDYSPLLRYGVPFALECYGLMCRCCYRPKAVVEYRRMAYVAKENRTRITFDSGVAATEACFDLFSPRLLEAPVLDPFQVVLEVKYNGFLLDLVKSVVSAADCSETAVSKYCLARGESLLCAL